MAEEAWCFGHFWPGFPVSLDAKLQGPGSSTTLTFEKNRSACVSAAFRLAVTVAYGRAADAIFNLGPLVF